MSERKKRKVEKLIINYELYSNQKIVEELLKVVNEHYYIFENAYTIDTIPKDDWKISGFHPFLNSVSHGILLNKDIVKDIVPKTPEEAIARACYYFGIDISMCEEQNIIDEYLNLFNIKNINYKPKDKFFKFCYYSKEKSFYSPFLIENFNHNIPYECYSFQLLDSYIYKKYKSNFINYLYIDKYYNLFQYNLLENFYWGKCGSNKNSSTVLNLSELIDLEFTDVLTFGVKREKCVYYTFEELNSIFEKYNDFINIKDGCKFNDYQIMYLVTILGKIKKNSPQYIIKKKLKKTIKKIENSFLIDITVIDDFKSFSDKDLFWLKKIFVNLNELVLTMRGWDGIMNKENFIKEEYKLERDFNATELNTSLKLVEFYKILDDSIQYIKYFFLDLPLIIYKYETYKVADDNVENMGNTIGDRLKIINKGEMVDNDEQSCLRMSSNYLCSSVYYYNSIFELKIENLINVKKMTHIY